MNGKISAKLIFVVLIAGLLHMLSHKPAIADPPGSNSLAIDCEVTITPSSVIATPGVTVQFSASTVCNRDSVDGTYSWEIMEMGSTGSTGSTINNNGLYTAGSTEGTDTVKVTDTVNGDISATAKVVVKSCTPSVSISPSSASIKYTETQQFSASTSCNGDALAGTYSWEIIEIGSTGSIINDNGGLYTAGSTEGTDTVKVTDTANGDISATAQVTVMECILSVDISPSSANLEFTETKQFSASTVCNGDILTGNYSWEVSEGSAGGKIDALSGLYTAGSTVGTDTVEVTDTANGDASATAQVMVKDCTPSVSISPSSASVKYTETQQFNATTSCNGDALAGTYSWEVSEGSAGGSIDTLSGLYTAGSTVGIDTVKVIDTTNGDISATVQIVVESALSIVVSPDSMLRSRWIILPYLMTIEGTDTNFVISSTKVSFTPAGSILGTPPLILDAESILQLIFVNSSLFFAGAEEETVTVTTGTEVATDDVAIEMLPFPLDEQK